MPATPTKGQKVKSGPDTSAEAADQHERAKDYLSPGEMTRLLNAAETGRHGVRDHLLLSMTYRHDLRPIQDYLGHRDSRHTVHYTRTVERRFEELWR